MGTQNLFDLWQEEAKEIKRRRDQLRAERGSTLSSPRGKHRRLLSPLRGQLVESSCGHDQLLRDSRSRSSMDSRKGSPGKRSPGYLRKRSPGNSSPGYLRKRSPGNSSPGYLRKGSPGNSSPGYLRKGSPSDRSYRGLTSRPSRDRWSRTRRIYQRDDKRDKRQLLSQGKAPVNSCWRTLADVSRFSRRMGRTLESGQGIRTNCNKYENLLEHESHEKCAPLPPMPDKPRLKVKSSIFQDGAGPRLDPPKCTCTVQRKLFFTLTRDRKATRAESAWLEASLCSTCTSAPPSSVQDIEDPALPVYVSII